MRRFSLFRSKHDRHGLSVALRGCVRVFSQANTARAIRFWSLCIYRQTATEACKLTIACWKVLGSLFILSRVGRCSLWRLNKINQNSLVRLYIQNVCDENSVWSEIDSKNMNEHQLHTRSGKVIFYKQSTVTASVEYIEDVRLVDCSCFSCHWIICDSRRSKWRWFEAHWTTTKRLFSLLSSNTYYGKSF